ncbi:PAAR domain-containing protein [Stenotrophomonas maltophilia]
MARMWIVVGDATTGGGRVLTGSSNTDIEGKAVACVGDKATCPKHGGAFEIVTGDPTLILDGKPIAREGDSLACGCRLLGGAQSLVYVVDGGGGGGGGASVSAPPAAPAAVDLWNATPPPSGFVARDAVATREVVLHCHYGDLDCTPARGVSYRATLSDGRVLSGHLDDEGRARLPQVSVGPVQVIYQHEADSTDSAEIEACRERLRAALQRIVQQTRQDFAADWRQWNSASAAHQAFLMELNRIEGQARGTWDWASGSVEAVWQLAVLRFKADAELRELSGLLLTGDWDGLDARIAGHRAAGEQVLDKASAIKEQLILLFDDGPTWQLLAAFPADWAKAVPPDELQELTQRYGSQFALDVVISVLLGAFSAGTAGTAYGGATWAARIGRLGQRLAALLDELGEAFTALARALRLRKRRHTESRAPDADGVVETRLPRTRAAGAAFGEARAHQAMLDKGLTPVGKTDGVYRPGENGIDGVYSHPDPPPDYVITEAKHNTGRLGGPYRDGTRQMDSEWINERLDSKVGVVEARRMRDAMNQGRVESILIRVAEDGTTQSYKLGVDGRVIGPSSF